MNSRERAILALNHQEADHIPLDIGGTGLSQIHGGQPGRHTGCINTRPNENTGHVVMRGASLKKFGTIRSVTNYE